MSSLRTTIILAAAALSCLANLSATAQIGSTTSEIQHQLEAHYTPATATPDGSDLVTGGTVLVLQKNDLVMNRVDMRIPVPNSYVNGSVKPSGLLGFLAKNGTGPDVTGNPAALNRKFNAGEKFFVTRIQTGSDGVMFQLMSDPIDNARYHATLKFPFAKGVSPTPEQVLATVAEVLATDSQDGAAPQGEVAGAAPAAPADAPAPEPKTIAQGQTREQVLASFGQPQRIAQLGTKEIDYYPDMKVTYVKNKVTDVQ